MISSVELVNWRTHNHTLMNFQRGVNVLVGVMGAGKSSILDAISYGLYGTFPALNHRRVNLDNTISNRPEVKGEAEIKVSFDVGDDTYTVTRKISRRGGSSAQLAKNGRYMQAQSERVTEEIEQLLKMDYDTFSRAVYAEQNRLDYFLELTKSERKKQIDEMLGLDNFAKAEENATTLVNRIRSRIEDSEKTLTEVDEESQKRQLGKLATERESSESEQKRLSADAATLKQSLAVSNSELARLKKQMEHKQQLKSEIAKLSSKIETLKSEIAKISIKEDASKVEAEYKSTDGIIQRSDIELRDMKRQRDRSHTELAKIDSELRLNEKRREERDRILGELKGRELATLEKELGEANSSIEQGNKRVAELGARRKEISEWVGELGKHISKCPICERELEDGLRKRLLSEKNLMLREMELQIESGSKSINEAKGKLEAVMKEHDNVKFASKRLMDPELKDLDKDGARLKAESAAKGKTVAELDKKIEDVESALKQARERYNKLAASIEELKRRKSYAADVERAGVQLSELNKEYDGIKVDEGALDRLQEKITKESGRLSALDSKAAGNERLLKNLTQQVDELTKQIARLSAIRGEIERWRGQLSSMNKFKSALIDTEGMLRTRLITSINAKMQDIWGKLYPYADYLAIRLEAMKDDYRLEANTGTDAERNGIWIDVDGIASGGERSMACLAMRISLAMVIVPNLRWLILDEPTHNIDESGINKVIEVFGSTLPNIIEQIFIITHDSDLKQISTAKVFQLNRNKDRNEATSVVEA